MHIEESNLRFTSRVQCVSRMIHYRVQESEHMGSIVIPDEPRTHETRGRVYIIIHIYIRETPPRTIAHTNTHAGIKTQTNIKIRPNNVYAQLQTHTVVYLVILERDVILVYRVPLLYSQLLRSCTELRGGQFLEIADGIVLVALDPDLLPEAIVQNHLDHLALQSPILLDTLPPPPCRVTVLSLSIFRGVRNVRTFFTSLRDPIVHPRHFSHVWD